ncbi:exonuclease [Microbacterium phage Zeta1847]|uniref:Exonuclease n=1 Tax=Microbacterium phage Zeta1847 TaxID=2201444 RepID=A0A2Z4Q9K2_9CAUD|nr:exonuclease [Microbacterium phage Zeta1847]AWY06660.1 exonuclease [Microbacterium phage Zeta1847]
MTTPKAKTESVGDARFYVSPDDPDVRHPGVTTILNALPKPWLKPWVSKVIAEAAADNVGVIVSMMMANPTGWRAAAVDLLKRAPDHLRDGAADTGTAAHDLFERMARGETVTDVSDELEPYRVHIDEFLNTVQPEFLYLEETVWSDPHRYAGSFDWLAKIDGEIVWGDTKTNKAGAKPEVGLQLAAYRNAPHMLARDGSRIPNIKGDSGAVFHLRPEGWSLTPVRVDDEVFETFLHLREVFEYDKTVSRTMLGTPVAFGPPEAAPKPRKPRAPRTASTTVTRTRTRKATA